MKHATLLFCSLAALMLQACTPEPMTAQPPVQRQRLAYLKQTSAIPVTCTAGADCAGKWARALEWVTKHSVYSIKTSTDSQIVTNGPIEPTTDAAFTVTKSATDAGSYTITFSSTCGKTPVCSPTELELHASFNNYVLYGSNG